MPGDKSPVVSRLAVLATVTVPASLPAPPDPPIAKPIEP